MQGGNIVQDMSNTKESRINKDKIQNTKNDDIIQDIKNKDTNVYTYYDTKNFSQQDCNIDDTGYDITGYEHQADFEQDELERNWCDEYNTISIKNNIITTDKANEQMIYEQTKDISNKKIVTISPDIDRREDILNNDNNDEDDNDIYEDKNIEKNAIKTLVNISPPSSSLYAINTSLPWNSNTVDKDTNNVSKIEEKNIINIIPNNEYIWNPDSNIVNSTNDTSYILCDNTIISSIPYDRTNNINDNNTVKYNNTINSINNNDTINTINDDVTKLIQLDNNCNKEIYYDNTSDNNKTQNVLKKLLNTSKLHKQQTRVPNITLTVEEKQRQIQHYKSQQMEGKKPTLKYMSEWACIEFNLCRKQNTGTLSRILHSEATLLDAENANLFRPNRRTKHRIITDKMSSIIRNIKLDGKPITHTLIQKTLHDVCNELNIPQTMRPIGSTGFCYSFRKRYGFLYCGNSRRSPETFQKKPKLTLINRYIQDHDIALSLYREGISVNILHRAQNKNINSNIKSTYNNDKVSLKVNIPEYIQNESCEYTIPQPIVVNTNPPNHSICTNTIQVSPTMSLYTYPTMLQPQYNNNNNNNDNNNNDNIIYEENCTKPAIIYQQSPHVSCYSNNSSYNGNERDMQCSPFDHDPK